MRGSQARARRHRPALRQLRGEPGAGLPHRRARPEGDRLRRGQARGRPAHGRDHPLSGRARRPGHGPCRPDAAVVQHDRRLQGAGPRRRRRRARSAPTPRRSPTPAPSPSCVEAVVEPLAREITGAVPVPTIGIGASPGLRRPDPGPRGHARPERRACRNSSSATAASPARSRRRSRAYAEEVRARAFPTDGQRLQAEGAASAGRAGHSSVCKAPGARLYSVARAPATGVPTTARRGQMSDIFREVDEDLRREQFKRLWDRYGSLRHRPRRSDRRRRRRLSRLWEYWQDSQAAGDRRPFRRGARARPTKASTRRRSPRSTRSPPTAAAAIRSSPASAVAGEKAAAGDDKGAVADYDAIADGAASPALDPRPRADPRRAASLPTARASPNLRSRIGDLAADRQSLAPDGARDPRPRRLPRRTTSPPPASISTRSPTTRNRRRTCARGRSSC